MSALALPTPDDEPVGRVGAGGRSEITWAEIAQRAPLMVTTMATFLDQQAVSSRPTTVGAFDIALRFFAGRVTQFDPTCRSMADVQRGHVEDFKIWQAARPGKRGKLLSTTTIRHRLGLLRTFFERIIEWGYDDAPPRVPIFPGDFPEAGRAPAQVPGRPHHGQVHGGGHGRSQPTSAAHDRAVGKDRHAGG